MPTYTKALYSILSGDPKPEGNPANNCCFEEDTGKYFKWDETQWVEIPCESLGDVDFIGAISVDGSAGISGTRTIPNVGTLTFKRGILIGFEPV